MDHQDRQSDILDLSALISIQDLRDFADLPAAATPPAATPPPFPPSLTPRAPVPPTSREISSAPPVQLATHFQDALPGFIALKTRIVHDLENHPQRLLTLEPSRREALASYLDRLAGLPPAPSSMSGSVDPAGGISRWITGPRSPAQSTALLAFFEEVALITLSQALLLKSWADRGVRAWNEKDLVNLNWALNTALKPLVPIDRENWLIARQNIYSWYKLSPALQKELQEAVGSWNLSREGASFLLQLLSAGRQARPENADPQGYDGRFYEALWSELPQFGVDFASCPIGPIRRPWMVFSPTLRDGACVRAAQPPSHSEIKWVGLEGSVFSLMVAEVSVLWQKPVAPPLWTVGMGLEVHSREQLNFSLGSPKPSLLNRITEMEACDVALVQEERATRTQGRSAEALRLRERLESLPYFKKIKGAATSLGDLQACVALSKLRPGGLLFWAREEPLTEADGREALNFLLERAKLLCEWDFSDLTHQLPGKLPLFPRYLYAFLRESEVEARMTHRPLRVTLHGQVRSHIEIPQILSDALKAGSRKPSEGSGTGESSTAALTLAREARAHWRIQARISPTEQRDWMERWPDPASQAVMRSLDRLRDQSMPLAAVSTIRSTPSGPTSWSVPSNTKGLWIHAEGRRLVARPLEGQAEQHGSGYMILLSDSRWIAPLCRYLESEQVHLWLENHAERKGDRWNLNEGLVRWIPVPRSLLGALGHGAASPAGTELGASAQPASSALKVARALLQKPKAEALAALARLGEEPIDLQIRGAVFAQAAWELDELRASLGACKSLVREDGRVRWGELLRLLPPSECVSVSLHPRVRTSGNLPVQLAIGRIDRVRSPQEGILLATEAGFSLRIVADSLTLIEMLWDQLEGLNSPTWSELVGHLKLPRRTELAESAATDVLRVHAQQEGRASELREFLGACRLF